MPRSAFDLDSAELKTLWKYLIEMGHPKPTPLIAKDGAVCLNPRLVLHAFVRPPPQVEQKLKENRGSIDLSGGRTSETLRNTAENWINITGGRSNKNQKETQEEDVADFLLLISEREDGLVNWTEFERAYVSLNEKVRRLADYFWRERLEEIAEANKRKENLVHIPITGSSVDSSRQSAEPTGQPEAAKSLSMLIVPGSAVSRDSISKGGVTNSVNMVNPIGDISDDEDSHSPRATQELSKNGSKTHIHAFEIDTSKNDKTKPKKKICKQKWWKTNWCFFVSIILFLLLCALAGLLAVMLTVPGYDYLNLKGEN